MWVQPAKRVALVVEDDVILRSDIVGELHSLGWLVLETSSGEGALAFLRSHHIDIVFTDIQLAGQLTGWDVAELSRAARNDFPVIYTSGNARDLSRSVDGSLFFRKPYDPADVSKACGRLLAAREGDPPRH